MDLREKALLWGYHESLVYIFFYFVREKKERKEERFELLTGTWFVDWKSFANFTITDYRASEFCDLRPFWGRRARFHRNYFFEMKIRKDVHVKYWKILWFNSFKSSIGIISWTLKCLSNIYKMNKYWKTELRLIWSDRILVPHWNNNGPIFLPWS